ncbi:MAG: glycerophosphodiester phosphodiesterase [Ferruginibacter sp.]
MKIFPSITLGAVLFLSACSSTKNMGTVKGFDKQGHRGCRGLMPENTIPAMLKAIDLGVNTLEMDVVFTKDMQAIVSHEPFFNHEITSLIITKYATSREYIDEKKEKSYNIYKMTFAETQEFDVGLKPHPRFPDQQKIAVHKPLLSELIDSAEAHSNKKIFYNVETKTQPATDNIFHPAPAVFVDELMKVINEKGIAARVIIQSFDMRTLQYLHQHYPALKTALLVEGKTNSSFRKQMKDLGFIPTIYSPEFIMVTDDLIKKCHSKKMKIIPWTVDDKAKIAELKTMGVDGIISDYPNLFNE